MTVLNKVYGVCFNRYIATVSEASRRLRSGVYIMNKSSLTRLFRVIITLSDVKEVTL